MTNAVTDLLSGIGNSAIAPITQQVTSLQQSAVSTAKEYVPVAGAAVLLLMIGANLSSDSIGDSVPRKYRNVLGWVILAGGIYVVWQWYRSLPQQSTPQS